MARTTLRTRKGTNVGEGLDKPRIFKQCTICPKRIDGYYVAPLGRLTKAIAFVQVTESLPAGKARRLARLILRDPALIRVRSGVIDLRGIPQTPIIGTIDSDHGAEVEFGNFVWPDR